MSAYGSASTADQIKGLVDRGLVIPDADFAVRCLTHIGYHRLRSYWIPFQSSRGSAARFRTGASFDQVITLYMFDQRLRSLLLEALSYVEISVRSQWSILVAQSSNRGEFALQDASLFDPAYYAGNLQELERNYNQVRKQNRIRFQDASIWDITPTMSFGILSKWFSILTDQRLRQSISDNYGVDETILENILKHLALVRNISAHHERVWNRAMEISLARPRRLGGSSSLALGFNAGDNRKIYNTLFIVIYLLDIIIPNGDWAERLIAFREAVSDNSAPYRRMGFPTGWREFAIWQKHLPK